MATLPTDRDVTDSSTDHATDHNTLHTRFNKDDNRKLVRVSRSTDQTGMSSGSFTVINWNQEDVDDDSMWSSGNGSRLVVPTAAAAGDIWVVAWRCYVSSNDNGVSWYMRLDPNTSGGDTTVEHNGQWPNGLFRHTMTIPFYDLSAADYVECSFYHDAGANRTLNSTESWAMMYRVRAA